MDFFGPRRRLNPMAADRPRKAKGCTENAIHPADVSKETATRKRDRKALTACSGLSSPRPSRPFHLPLFLNPRGPRYPSGQDRVDPTVFFLIEKDLVRFPIRVLFYQTGYPIVVPEVGLEPTRCRHQRILSPSRLPFHHSGKCLFILVHWPEKNQGRTWELRNLHGVRDGTMV